MTRKEVIAKRKELNAELRKAQGAVKIVEAKMEALENECEHPKLRKYSAMGEIGDYCPDCEYQT